MSGPAAVPLAAKTERCGFSSSRKRRRDAGGNEFPLRPPGMPPMMPLVGDPQIRAWHGEEQSAPISWQPFAGAAAGDVSTAGSGPGGCVFSRALAVDTHVLVLGVRDLPMTLLALPFEFAVEKMSAEAASICDHVVGKGNCVELTDGKDFEAIWRPTCSKQSSAMETSI